MGRSHHSGLREILGCVTIGFLALFAVSCKSDVPVNEDLIPVDLMHQSMDRFTDVIVHDIFSPPQASRNYVYPCLAFYEVMALGDSTLQSLHGQISHAPATPAPEAAVSYRLSALYAFVYTAREFIFSQDKMDAYISEMDQQLAELDIPSKVMKASQSYAKQVSQVIVNWSSSDNYAQTRSFPKHAIDDEPDTWKPTPPAYMEGIEPHWKKIRPMILASADQFQPKPPTPVSKLKSSQFFTEVMEVYDTGLKAQQEEREIASFWDCNPYVMNQTGHMMFATKKITPGGHWMGIVKIACQQSKADWATTARAYAMCSIALFDAFISCWDEKYRSNLIRPETYINEHIDPSWKPLLQTPPFPEYTSGHSVISTAAAVALTSIFGDDFAFEDTTELKYGLPVRSFSSFYAASAEAAVSRLYGGIHYRPAIEEGVNQGKQVGELLVSSVQLTL